MEFVEFPKIARLSRECTISEKIDGTNGIIAIGEDGSFKVGSRTRWLDATTGDNHGFLLWAMTNKDELLKLGPGRHFGEWWGSGIQRGYGLQKGEKRFSLFNTHRWSDAAGVRPACCHVVPVLFQGPFTTQAVDSIIALLASEGSKAAPGFMDPEGIIVYHTASGELFKKTVKGDEEGKHQEGQVVIPKAPRPPKDPSKGGRRIAQLPYEGPDRRRGSSVGERPLVKREDAGSFPALGANESLTA